MPPLNPSLHPRASPLEMRKSPEQGLADAAVVGETALRPAQAPLTEALPAQSPRGGRPLAAAARSRQPESSRTEAEAVATAASAVVEPESSRTGAEAGATAATAAPSAKKTVRFDPSLNEVFQPSCHDFTPRIPQRTAFRAVQQRLDVGSVCGPSTVARPNHEDMLRRVAIIIHKHIISCEERWKHTAKDKRESGMFYQSKLDAYDEREYVTPRHRITFLRMPGAALGSSFSLQKIEHSYNTPDVAMVHSFVATLFRRAYLSAECAVVSLIYLERLMENHAPLMAATWRPVVLCSLLLASKVWQDLSSWNIEFSQTYPEFSLQSINKLERVFLQDINWDLYISPSLYAKYHFALRSMTAQSNFRSKYINMLPQQPANASAVEQRSTAVKEDMLRLLSKSL